MRLKRLLKSEKFQRPISKKQDERLKSVQRALIKLMKKWKRSKLNCDKNERKSKVLNMKLII